MWYLLSAVETALGGSDTITAQTIGQWSGLFRLPPRAEAMAAFYRGIGGLVTS